MPITLHGIAANPEDLASEQSEPVTLAVTPPASMVAGDLAVFLAFMRQNNPATDPAISNNGGQSWNNDGETNSPSGNAAHFHLWWATFDGTWDANPSIIFASLSGTVACTAILIVFRPPSASDTWTIEQSIFENDVEFASPSSPFTVTITPTFATTGETVTLALWGCSDDNTWGSLSGSGWVVTGTAQYRNTAGTDMSASFAHNIRSTAGTPAAASKNMNAGDPGIRATVVFKATGPAEPQPTKPMLVLQAVNRAATY